jgi:hypothetical protein
VPCYNESAQVEVAHAALRGDDPAAAADRVATPAERCFAYRPDEAALSQPTMCARYEPVADGCAVELPRVALVATGVRP